jgi:hypothetical protein
VPVLGALAAATAAVGGEDVAAVVAAAGVALGAALGAAPATGVVAGWAAAPGVLGAAAGAPGFATTGVRASLTTTVVAPGFGGAVLIVTRAGVPTATVVAESVSLFVWMMMA